MMDYENDYRVEQRKRLALQSTLVRIKDLEDSEAGEPLDEAISLAKKALDALGDPVAEGKLIAPEGTDRCTICGFVVDLRYEAVKPTISFGMAGRAPRRTDLNAKADVEKGLLEALEAKRQQLSDYRDGIDLFTAVGNHAFTVADGRIQQIEMDIAFVKDALASRHQHDEGRG